MIRPQTNASARYIAHSNGHLSAISEPYLRREQTSAARRPRGVIFIGDGRKTVTHFARLILFGFCIAETACPMTDLAIGA